MKTEIKVCCICKSSHKSEECLPWPVSMRGKCCSACYNKRVVKVKNKLLKLRASKKERKIFEALEVLYKFHDIKQRNRYNALKNKLVKE